jgi:hypothetical protein
MFTLSTKGSSRCENKNLSLNFGKNLFNPKKKNQVCNDAIQVIPFLKQKS